MNAVTLLPPRLPVSSAAQNRLAGAPVAQKPGSSPGDRKLMKECRQFESILIANMWNEMEKGISLSNRGSDPGAGTMQGFAIQAAAMGIARAGGMGIARMLYDELAPYTQNGQSHPPTAGIGQRK